MSKFFRDQPLGAVMINQDNEILMVPAHTKPPLSERQWYWVIGGVLCGIILIQWGVS